MVGIGELALVVAQLVRGHRAELGVALLGHVAKALGLGAEAADVAGGRGHRLQLGIFLRDLDEAVARKLARRHQRGELVATGLDLADAVEGDGGHARASSPRA